MHNIGFLMVYLPVVTVTASILGCVAKMVNQNRGCHGGFWWGFFLGVAGIMVVAIRPLNQRDEKINSAEN